MSPVHARRDPTPATVGAVSTRMLVSMTLVCGMVILVAFAVQVLVAA
mgnify:CR=1 FL=1|jgi:flagellar biogenesis protein FliO